MKTLSLKSVQHYMALIARKLVTVDIAVRNIPILPIYLYIQEGLYLIEITGKTRKPN